jgi:hypothetical protein
LIIAVKNGCVENAKLLIARGAALDVQDKNGNTALLIAANSENCVELLKVLLSESPDKLKVPKSKPSRPPNALLKNNAGEGIRVLLGSREYKSPEERHYHQIKPRKLLFASLDKSDRALFEVCNQGKISDASTLLVHGVDTTGKNRDGNCVLHVAAIAGNYDIVKLLLDCDAKIDAFNDEKLTALHLAARHGHIGVVYLLLQGGANPDGIAAALLSEEADAAQYQRSSSSSTSQTATGKNRDIILDLLKFHPYLSGTDAEMPVFGIPVDALLKSVDDVDTSGTTQYETLAAYGLCRHIIAGLRKRSVEWGIFEKAMLAGSKWERVSEGQKQACWVVLLSSLWNHALESEAKELLKKNHVPEFAVKRYSRLLKQQVMWLLNTAASKEMAIFKKMLAFDEQLANYFAQAGYYDTYSHYKHLKNCGMASGLAAFIVYECMEAIRFSLPSNFSISEFGKVVVAALSKETLQTNLEKWLEEAPGDLPGDALFQAILKRQIDQLKQACQQLPKDEGKNCIIN